MKRFLFGTAILAMFFGLLLPNHAAAIPINVSQGGVFLGTINPYTGTDTGAVNYKLESASGHPIIGPSPADKEGQIFFYDGSDGLNLTMIFGRDDSGVSYQKVQWDITVAGSTTDPVVRLADDNTTETKEVDNTNVFLGRWSFGNNTDGAVIGEIGGSGFAINIDPLLYQNIDTLKVFDTAGSFITLNLNTDTYGDILLTPTPVPEPATMLLLGSGLIGLAGFRRKRATGGRNA